MVTGGIDSGTSAATDQAIDFSGTSLERVIRSIAERLAVAGIDDARRESRALVEQSIGIALADQLARPDRKLTDDQIRCLEKNTRLRERRISLAAIVGQRVFFGRAFDVGPGVLIPRPETELVVEAALEAIASIFPQRVSLLDLCTGSGCLGLTLALELLERNYDVRGVLTDVDAAALRYADRNRNRFGLESRIELVETDVWPQSPQTFDVLVANPPYISTGDLAGLMPEVRDFEPLHALDGGEDGLQFYRRIIGEMKPWLSRPALVWFEHGEGQRAAIRSMVLEAMSVERIWEIDDLSGIDRVFGFLC